jgi:hypothetical protein
MSGRPAQVNPAFAERLDIVHRWSLRILDLVARPETSDKARTGPVRG